MFSLRRSLLQSLLRTKLQGFPGFSRAWPLPTQVPDRTTLWRWLNGRSNVPQTLVLALAGSFDVDPCALFEITPKAYAALCRALVRNIGTNQAYPVTQDLQWFAPFAVPSEKWPSNDIPARYFRKSWTTQSFRHTAQREKNFFQKLLITAEPRSHSAPQVGHFAFRNQTPTSLLWIPYGFVERTAQGITLFHYHARGHSESQTISPDANGFVVETWLGGGPADFCVASLHDFKLTLSKDPDPTMPCLRFP